MNRFSRILVFFVASVLLSGAWHDFFNDCPLCHQHEGTHHEQGNQDGHNDGQPGKAHSGDCAFSNGFLVLGIDTELPPLKFEGLVGLQALDFRADWKSLSPSPFEGRGPPVFGIC